MNIFKNVSIKALAIISALLLWFFVVGVENYVYLFPQPLAVKVVNLGQNVSVANEIATAKIRYKSGDGTINTLNANDFDLYIDASGLGEGDYQLPVRYTSKEAKISVVAVEPAVVNLKLEAITSKDITLKTEVTGTPAKDYEIKSVKADLDKVKLSGAASAIANIKGLDLKINLDGSETADFSRKMTLEAPSEWKLTGKTVSFDPAVVQVEIEVRKVQKPVVEVPVTLPNNGVTIGDSNAVPVETGMTRKTVMVDVVAEDSMVSAVKEFLPGNILVTLEGSPEAIAQLNNNSVKLVIRSSEIVKGAYTVNPADLELPQDMELKVIELSPAKVTVKF